MPWSLGLVVVLAVSALLGVLAGDPPAGAPEARAVVDAPLRAQATPPPTAPPPSALAPPPPPPTAPQPPPPTAPPPSATTTTPAPDAPGGRRRSRALGLPFRRGRLVGGVQLPAEGADFLTWDFPLRRSPSRSWRRWGTDVLVRTVLEVLAEHRTANPGAPRVLVGDLSRPRGGVFDRRFGGIGHASHQNGLDVDVYYPRRDGLPLPPGRPGQVDRALAQDLVDRFLAAGAEVVFVGRRVGLRGIGGRGARVQAIPHHEDHLHVRLANPARSDGRQACCRK